MSLPQADTGSPTEEVQSRRPTPKDFRPDIEGLRGFTLLAILGFHAEVPGVGGGFVGPDVFFIISGFVITGQLWREVSKTGTIKLRPFYGARARRLLPVSAAIGVVIVIASAILLPPLQARPAVGDGIACALYVGNYWFILRGVDYFATHVPPSPFQHYWTLGVEEQFYLLWPPMIIGLGMAHPTPCASPKRHHRHPHEAPVSGALDADHGRCRSRSRSWRHTWFLLRRISRCPPGPGICPSAAWWP